MLEQAGKDAGSSGGEMTGLGEIKTPIIICSPYCVGQIKILRPIAAPGELTHMGLTVDTEIYLVKAQ